MRKIWLEITKTGSLEGIGWKRVDETADWPASYVGMSINTQYKAEENLRKEYCDFWAPFGGQSQWWTN